MSNNKIQDAANNQESGSLHNSKNLPSVLLIEDDAINASVIQKFIRKDYKVDMAYSSVKSIEMATENSYDIILLDINLGRGMNGIDVLKEIKKTVKNSNTPVIASTAYTMKGDKEKLLQAGFDDYISKPYTMNEILVKIKQVIDKTNK
jgi:CheY-like chemotaxis protein